MNTGPVEIPEFDPAWLEDENSWDELPAGEAILGEPDDLPEDISEGV